MQIEEILSHIDHTLLSPTACWEDIQALCRQAIRYGFASVCVAPCYVARIRREYGDAVRICTVAGFPLGYATTAAKLTEARQAVEDGADEVDMVINLTDVKNGDLARVQNEMAQMKQAVDTRILKVIVETCYLNTEEKIALCKAVTQAGVDFIKTSTGFGPAGASLEDIRLFRQHIGPQVQIKAAGGIRTFEAMAQYLQAGCSRLGTSAAAALLAGAPPAAY